MGTGVEEAASTYLDQNPKALAVWRAHQWLWENADVATTYHNTRIMI